MSLETNDFYTNIEELIRDTRMGRPHVVILGAGASKAAFPEGDRNGKKIPIMDDLVETIGLNSIFEKQGIGYAHRNFEKFIVNYMKIAVMNMFVKLSRIKCGSILVNWNCCLTRHYMII